MAFLGDPFPGIMMGGVMVLPGSFFLAQLIYRSIVATKRAALESLVERLADHCEDAAR